MSDPLVYAFSPTKHQKMVRDRVRDLYDQGFCLVSQWAKMIPDFTVNDWRLWDQEDGFMDWWVELIPENSGLTMADAKAMTVEASIALIEGVRSGDTRAISALLALASSAQSSQQVSDNEVDSWFESGEKQPNRWLEDNDDK